MTVNAITDTKKGRTGIAPTYLHTTRTVLLGLGRHNVRHLIRLRKAAFYRHLLQSSDITSS